VTIPFPAREQPVPTPLPQTPQNPVLPSRQSTAFFTPPSHPPQSPPLRPRPVWIDTSLPGPSFGPLPVPPVLPQLRPNPHPNLYYAAQETVARLPPRQHNRRIGHTELLAAAEESLPVKFQKVMNSTLADEWQEVCQYEMDALAKNGMWELVDLPVGHKAVKSKWVFKRKADRRFRTQVVAKGFTQIQGIDYDKTFSPVARFESLRLLLVLATLEDWEIHQMDVKSAFLNGLLDEEIYIEQPKGFAVLGQEHKVCLLKKAIYSLKQALCMWNLLFHTVLIGLGFTRTRSDAGVYVYHLLDGEGMVIIILYVNDITLLGDSSKEINQIKLVLSSWFKMTDLREIESYLGVRIIRDRLLKTLKIDQSCYVHEIIEHFGMVDSNPARTPLPAGAETHLLVHTGEASPKEIKYYQKIIGSLLYVQIETHLDISFAVARLSQYASNPSPQHLRLAKYILSYLKGTADLCICYDRTWGDRMHGYSDSSLGDHPDDYHSTSGYVYLLADGTISWTSHK
jgi:hypothetical protein